MNDSNTSVETNTHYLDGFQYTDDHLDFFPHAEGYVNVLEYSELNYVYTYKDHLGNIRLRYALDPGTSELAILEEDHYYPFGLKHRGYNSEHEVFERDPQIGVVLVPVNPFLEDRFKYKFQGQEKQDEFGLNWDSFKWRNYMPDIGRFFNIDPLAEKFVYNSPYAFSENKVISHFELEGLEAVLAITMGKDVRYRGGMLQGANPSAQHVNLQSGGASSFVDAFRTASASDPKGIGFVAIWGHGTPGNIWGSGSSGNTNISTSDLSGLNDAIKNGDISFANNAIIYLGNCNAGTGDARSFAAELSKITGATVIGGDASVGLGMDGSQIENTTSMIYWMYNPRKDSFLSFENGIEVDNLGGSIDVIQLMNAAMRITNPATPASTLTPQGISGSTGQQACYDCERKRRDQLIRDWNGSSDRLHDNNYMPYDRF